MIKPQNYLFLFTLAVLPGCVFDHGELWEDSPYVVMWIDNLDNLNLNYDLGDGGSIGRVDEKVVAVGSNEKYVVVKQNPSGDKAKINYYFIDRAKDHKYADSTDAVSGPLSTSEFANKKIELNLPEFSKEFK